MEKFYLKIELPEAFKRHFENDKFKDSFGRICFDINEIQEARTNEVCEQIFLSGNYELELVNALKTAFENCEIDTLS